MSKNREPTPAGGTGTPGGDANGAPAALREMWHNNCEMSTEIVGFSIYDLRAIPFNTTDLHGLGAGQAIIGDRLFCEYHGAMQVSENIQCPFCGQTFELVIDTSVPSQRFTTDCEVCCRPFEVVAECETGEILSLEARAE